MCFAAVTQDRERATSGSRKVCIPLFIIIYIYIINYTYIYEDIIAIPYPDSAGARKDDIRTIFGYYNFKSYPIIYMKWNILKYIHKSNYKFHWKYLIIILFYIRGILQIYIIYNIYKNIINIFEYKY